MISTLIRSNSIVEFPSWRAPRGDYGSKIRDRRALERR
jgi:hypothetical protein